MTYNQEFVKELLVNYKDNQKKVKCLGINDKYLTFLELCLKSLEPYESDLLKTLFIEKISIRQYSRITGFSRDFVAKERDRLIRLIAQFFTLKFA